MYEKAHKMVTDSNGQIVGLATRRNDGGIKRPIYKFDDGMFQTFKTDFDRFIYVLSPPTVHVDVREGVKPLPAGVETLQDTFGEMVYLNKTKNGATCPVCGPGQEMGLRFGALGCIRCGSSIKVVKEISTGHGVKVSDVLELNAQKYHFNRPWSGPEISHPELCEKLEKFNKEKEKV
jgi:hypothetical protein